MDDSHDMAAREQASAEVSLIRTFQDGRWRGRMEERRVNNKVQYIKRVQRSHTSRSNPCGPSRCLNSGGSVPSSCEE